MIESAIIAYLKEKLPGEKISAEVPKGMPQRFITVERTGSQQLGVGFYESTVAVQSWETSKAKAAQLSEKVCRAMEIMPDFEDCVTRSTGADYDFTDTETKRYRYQAVFTIRHY